MIINEKFKNLIPELSTEEFKQLEENCISEGIRDSIILWNDTIIDGHNRYSISQKHGIQYKTESMNFDNENDVIVWIILNQFGRRNLSNYQRSILALKLEILFSEKAKNNLIEGGKISQKQGCQISDKAIDTKKELSKIASVSHDTIARVKKIEASASPEMKKRLQNEEISVNQAYIEIRKEEKKSEFIANIEKQKDDIKNNNISELHGLYDIISIDPPWSYGRKYDPEGSRVANPYPEMDIEEIMNIRLPFKDDAILFLWTTHKFLPHSFDIIKSWGFDYKATLVWNKEKIGMGAWFRMQCEFCIFAIKGKPLWNNSTERDIITESRREHSRKPDSFFDMIDRICFGRKLEYFAREKRNGWDIFGNDTGKFSDGLE